MSDDRDEMECEHLRLKSGDPECPQCGIEFEWSDILEDRHFVRRRDGHVITVAHGDQMPSHEYFEIDSTSKEKR